MSFSFFVTSSDSIVNEMHNAIINMLGTRQLAIILAFVALWEITIEEMATVLEKGSRLRFFL